MSLRSKQTLSVATGAAPTFSAATASDTMPVGDNLVAEYRNTDANAKTITVVMPSGLTLETGADYPDKVYNLAAGNVTMQELRIPLIRKFLDVDTGVATITVTGTGGVTGVTMAVVER